MIVGADQRQRLDVAVVEAFPSEDVGGEILHIGV